MKTPPLSVAVLVSAGINPTSGSPRAARGDADVGLARLARAVDDAAHHRDPDRFGESSSFDRLVHGLRQPEDVHFRAAARRAGAARREDAHAAAVEDVQHSLAEVERALHVLAQFTLGLRRDEAPDVHHA